MSAILYPPVSDLICFQASASFFASPSIPRPRVLDTQSCSEPAANATTFSSRRPSRHILVYISASLPCSHTHVWRSGVPSHPTIQTDNDSRHEQDPSVVEIILQLGAHTIGRISNLPSHPVLFFPISLCL